MPEFIKADNPNPAPEGTTGEGTGKEQFEEMSFGELEKLVKERSTKGEAVSEEEVSEEVVDVSMEKETGQEVGGMVGEEDEEKLKKYLEKSKEELVKELVNLQKLLGRQSNEIGELRKLKEEIEKMQTEKEAYRIYSLLENLEAEEDLSEQEVEEILEELSSSPYKAIKKIAMRSLEPLLIRITKTDFERKSQELREKTKDSLVPFSEYEQEVYKLLDSFTDKNKGNELIRKYGVDALEVAYNMVKQRVADEAYKKRVTELEEKYKKAQGETKKGRTYVESPGGRASGGELDYENMPFKELEKLVKKLSEKK